MQQIDLITPTKQVLFYNLNGSEGKGHIRMRWAWNTVYDEVEAESAIAAATREYRETLALRYASSEERKAALAAVLAAEQHNEVDEGLLKQDRA